MYHTFLVVLGGKDKNSSSQKLTLVCLPAAPDLLSSVTAAYEMLSVLFTTVRTMQTLNIGGSWWAQRKTLTFLVLREGLRYRLLNCSVPNYSALGLLYFGWDIFL